MVGTLISGQPTLAFLRNTPGGRSNKLTGKYANGFSVYNISRFAIIGKIEPERLRVVDNLATESTMKDNSWGDEWDKMVVKHSLLAISSEFEDMGSMDDALFWSKRQVIMAALIFALCSANKPSITAEAAEDNDRDSTKQSANSNIVSDTPKQSVPNKSIFAGLLNTQSWYQFRGEGFSVRVPPDFDDLTEPEDYSAGSSLYGERAKPKTFAARFASSDGSEVLSVVVRPSTQLKLTFLEAQDISDLGSLRDAANLFVPGGATLFAARTIKVKDSIIPRYLEAYRMVQKWNLCIEVSCYPNPCQVIIAYVLHNMALNHVLQTKREVHGKTTNNEAYYIALVEGLKEEKKYGANDIVAFTNSQLICNQMKGIYQVRKENLKPIHTEERIVASQF